MSSVLNVSNGSSKSEEFNLNNIEVLVDKKEQNWFKRAHMLQYLRRAHIITSTTKLSEEDIRSRVFLQAEAGIYSMDPSRKDVQDHDIFILLTGALYVTVNVNSRKDKVKALKKHILKDIVPCAFDTRIEEIQGKHQQAITGRGKQIKALESTNEKHQQKILRLNKKIDDLIENRHTARRGCFDNVLCFIKKNRKEVYPYYVIQCQYKQLEKHKQWLKLRYPNMEVLDKCDDPNAIHRWNRFNHEVIKKPSYYKNLFSLTKKKQELLETALDVTI